MTEPTFDRFWEIMPRKVGKLAAFAVWQRVIKTTDPATIIEGAKRYAAEREGKEIEYTCHPRTFLSQGRWQDQPPIPPKKKTTPYKGIKTHSFVDQAEFDREYRIRWAGKVAPNRIYYPPLAAESDLQSEK